MRDRLTKLIINAPKLEIKFGSRAQGRTLQTAQNIADYLLANGVIVPHFNCGDRVWFILKGLNEVCEATVTKVEYNYFTSPQEWVEVEYLSSSVGHQFYKSRIDLMLGKTVFLTREEVEAKLKGEQ